MMMGTVIVLVVVVQQRRPQVAEGPDNADQGDQRRHAYGPNEPDHVRPDRRLVAPDVYTMVRRRVMQLLCLPRSMVLPLVLLLRMGMFHPSLAVQHPTARMAVVVVSFLRR